ncbi:hypothetical protein AAC387_Pa10g0717 [Persea americana]
MGESLLPFNCPLDSSLESVLKSSLTLATSSSSYWAAFIYLEPIKMLCKPEIPFETTADAEEEEPEICMSSPLAGDIAGSGAGTGTLGSSRSRIWKSKGKAQEAAKKDFIDCLKLLEEKLGDKLFYGGKSLGYMDVVLVPFACWFYTYKTDDNFSKENEFPKLIACVKRCMEKESVSKFLPDPHQVYDYVGVLKKYGVEFW